MCASEFAWSLRRSFRLCRLDKVTHAMTAEESNVLSMRLRFHGSKELGHFIVDLAVTSSQSVFLCITYRVDRARQMHVLEDALAVVLSYQTLSEIGRVQKTIHILKTLDNEEYRRRMGRELNKGEASHDLSRFLCFGKEGVLRGREFGDQVQTFSCLSVLHNAVVAWNMLQIGDIVSQLRAEGNKIDDETLSHVTPLIRKHINPFGRYHFDLNRIRQPRGGGGNKIDDETLSH